MENPPVVWTNNRVTLGMDLLFGLVMLSTEGWVIVADLDTYDIQKVRSLIDHDRSFMWYDELDRAELNGTCCEESAGFAFGA